jgi:hypothetical protein
MNGQRYRRTACAHSHTHTHTLTHTPLSSPLPCSETSTCPRHLPFPAAAACPFFPLPSHVPITSFFCMDMSSRILTLPRSPLVHPPLNRPHPSSPAGFTRVFFLPLRFLSVSLPLPFGQYSTNRIFCHSVATHIPLLPSLSPSFCSSGSSFVTSKQRFSEFPTLTPPCTRAGMHSLSIATCMRNCGCTCMHMHMRQLQLQ